MRRWWRDADSDSDSGPDPDSDGDHARAIAVLRCVVEGCFAGMGDYPELLEERGGHTQDALREEIVTLLAANAATQRLAWEQRFLVRRMLPERQYPDIGVEFLQGVSEGLAILAADAADPLLPEAEDLALWIADPDMLAWLHDTSDGVPDELRAWAEAERDELEVSAVGAVRRRQAERRLRAELLELATVYPVLVETYADKATRHVASDAAWDRIVPLARLLREVKGPSCRAVQFDAPAIALALELIHQVFASLVMMVEGEDEPSAFLPTTAIERMLAHGPLSAWG
jgi:hypothetical protein